MRDTFRGYYRPTTEEFSDLWKNCLFVFDANVLLDLYRYSPKTREDLIEILQKISDRIWIPHQAALEYQKRRLTVIGQQESAYEDIKKLLIKLQKNIEKELNSYSKHQFINTDHICDKINNIITEVTQELDSSKQDHPNLIDNDELRETITNLFEGKVGSPYSSDKIEEIYKIGKKRYSRNIPPGFEDKNKDDMREYGDLVLWFQIIDHIKSIKKPIIFITDDRKEDWWQKFKGKTISPQPQLINEIFCETTEKFYMYQTEKFMEYCWEYFKEQVNQEALNEIREIRKQDEEDEKTKEMTIEQYSSLYLGLPTLAEQYGALHQGLPAFAEQYSSLYKGLSALAEQYSSLYQGLPALSEQYRSLYQTTPAFLLKKQKRNQLETKEEENESAEQSETKIE